MSAPIAQKGVESDARGPWMQTFTGRAFHLLDPRPEEVDLLDIAHALSHLCRFTGHVRQHYSVAEHCVRVSWLSELMVTAETPWPGVDAPAGAWQREHARFGLLHDAAEAYVGDCAGPLKAAMRALCDQVVAVGVHDSVRIHSPYDRIEDAVERAVCKRFGILDHPFSIDHARLRTNVKRADLVLLATEKRDLKAGAPKVWETLDGIEPLERRIEPWSAQAAELHFLARAAELGLR